MRFEPRTVGRLYSADQCSTTAPSELILLELKISSLIDKLFSIILKVKSKGRKTENHEFLGKFSLNLANFDILLLYTSPPARATNKSIFDGKSHAIHHFYELFELISNM